MKYFSYFVRCMNKENKNMSNCVNDGGLHVILTAPKASLFCSSKWRGDPDLPADMPFPMIEDMPLTFICQIDCYELSKFDNTGLVPKDGMLYFFAALDEYDGYESDIHNGEGEWPKGMAVVKYTKQINMETFESFILLDDEDQPISQPALEIVLRDNEEVVEKEDATNLESEEVCAAKIMKKVDDETVALLHIESENASGFYFPEGYAFEIQMKAKDLGFGNWKRARAVLVKL